MLCCKEQSPGLRPKLTPLSGGSFPKRSRSDPGKEHRGGTLAAGGSCKTGVLLESHR